MEGYIKDRLLKELDWEMLSNSKDESTVDYFCLIRLSVNNKAPQYSRYYIPEENNIKYNLRNHPLVTENILRILPFSKTFFPVCTKSWSNLTSDTVQWLRHGMDWGWTCPTRSIFEFLEIRQKKAIV